MKNQIRILLITSCVFLMFNDSSNVLMAQTGGPGTEMTRIINRLGLGSDCVRCKSLANQMDQRGPVWVRQNFDYVVNRTVGNAENLGYRMGPARRVGVRTIVRRATRRAAR